MEQIATLESLGAPPLDQFVRRFWSGPLPIGFATEATASVVVNHNRWIVRCPFPPCRGVEIAARTDHRFFCCSCGNKTAGGLWLRVQWPDTAEAIEAALLVRPDPDTRNWELGETVDDLRAENAEHGIAS